MPTAIFTLCTYNYLSKATILLQSLQQYAPETDVFLLLIESPEKIANFYLEKLPQVKILNLNDLDFKGCDYRRLAFQYDALEFSCLLKPVMFNYLLNKHYDKIIFLDGDVNLYAPLTYIEQLLDDYDMVLTPHITSPLPDDKLIPNEINFIYVGQYNAGFMALKNSPDARVFVDYHLKSCVNYGLMPYDGVRLFADQFFLALAPCFVEKIKILRHRSYNVAYWNLAQRNLSKIDNIYYTEDGPLVFFHFSGLPENDICKVSKHSKRVTTKPGTPLYQLLAEYVAADKFLRPQFQLLAQYSYNYYHDGEKINLQDRRKYLFLGTLEKDQLGDPFKARDKIRSITKIVGSLQDNRSLLETVNTYYSELANIKRSLTWRAGRLILFPFRALRYLLLKWNVV